MCVYINIIPSRTLGLFYIKQNTSQNVSKSEQKEKQSNFFPLPLIIAATHTPHRSVIEDLKIMGQWENLPADLLIEVEKFVILYPDKVRFSSVCKSWKSTLPRMPDLKQRQLPWLLHPCNETKASKSCYGLFNLLDQKTYYLDLPTKTERILFRGSSHGWVVSVEGPRDEIYLMNPFTRAKIQLPSRSKFPDVKDFCADRHNQEYNLWNRAGDRCYPLDSTSVRKSLTDKLFISSNPGLTNDYVVVTIYGEFCRLAYCKQGDEKWTFLCGISCYSDVIFYEGKIYALIYNGWLRVFDIHHDNPQVVDLSPPYPFLGSSLIYIVESSYGLLLVERPLELYEINDPVREFECKTLLFNVFKLDHASSRWCKITDIGDEVLFIGFNTSVSRSFLEFPELKRNSIYFTDNVFSSHYEGIHGGSQIGVFDLNSQSMESLPGYQCDSNLIWPPPIWVIPTPY